MKVLDTIAALETSARNRATAMDNTRVRQAAEGTPAQYLPPSGKSLRAQADDLKSLHQALAVLWRDAHTHTAAAAALVSTLQQLKLPAEEAQELLVRPRVHQRPQRASSGRQGGSIDMLPEVAQPPKWGDTLKAFLSWQPSQPAVRRVPAQPAPEPEVYVQPRVLPSFLRWGAAGE